jgi:putative drug exporter of the RND superfamily
MTGQDYHYLSHRRSLAWMVFWLVLVSLLALPAWNFSHQIKGTLTGIPDSDAEHVRKALEENFSTALAYPTAVVWNGAGLSPEQRQTRWQAILDAVKSDENVTLVSDARRMLDKWPRDDWYAAFVELKATSYGDAEKKIPGLRKKLHGESIKAADGTTTLPAAQQPKITGGPALFMDLNLSSTDALRQAEIKALPVAFIILLFVFRSVVAALLPVAVAGVGVLVTLGGISLLANYWPVTFFVPNLITMIGLGVGIDYSLIFLARYRRERDMHLTKQEALRVTMQTAGRTVVTSAVMVMSGFVSLLVIPLQFFHSIAVAGMLVVGCVAASTLTLLPSFIMLLGQYLEWGRIVSRKNPLSERMRLLYHHWARLLLAYKWGWFIAGTFLLLLLAYPLTKLKVTAIQVNTLPLTAEARQGYDSLSRELGAGWLMPTILLVNHPDENWIMDEAAMARERDLVAKIRQLDNTADVVSLANDPTSSAVKKARMATMIGSNDIKQSLILLISKTDPQSAEAREWFKKVSNIIKTHEIDNGGEDYHIGGIAATTISADDVIFGALPKVILVTLCTTFLLLMYYMRAFLVPLKAITLNFLCVLAAYGFQVLWFEQGLGSFAHFAQTGGVNTIVLVILFCTLFGLSMDYEVFILCAIRESWLDEHNMNLAIEDGLQRTAGIITSAAVIMVSVFLCFAFGAVVETQQLGIGLSFAVLLDATIIRLVLAPSAMAIMGKWSWWLPGRKLHIAPAAKSTAAKSAPPRQRDVGSKN